VAKRLESEIEIMKRASLIIISLVIILLVLVVFFLKIPSPPGPLHVLDLSVGALLSSNDVYKTYAVSISNTQDSFVLYPSSGIETGHHPLLDFEYPTNADSIPMIDNWKYRIENDLRGTISKLPPHKSLSSKVNVPNDVSRFRVGIYRVNLSWRGQLGFPELDIKHRSKHDWSPAYQVTNDSVIELHIPN
jgi:hypothetical protein